MINAAGSRQAPCFQLWQAVGVIVKKPPIRVAFRIYRRHACGEAIILLYRCRVAPVDGVDRAAVIEHKIDHKDLLGTVIEIHRDRNGILQG